MRYAVIGGTLLAALCLVVPGAAAQDAMSRDSVGARAAAEWLQLVHSGQHQSSWEEAAPIFRENVSAQDWEGTAVQVLDQTGSLTSRTISQITHTTSAPGLPPGDYLIVEYRSAFERLAPVTEVVALMNIGGSEWRVIGYFLRPAA